MKEEKILTMHPKNATGEILPMKLYEMVKQAIVEGFLIKPKATLEEILAGVEKSLKGKTDANLKKVVPVINMDLEVRQYIERILNTDPVEFQLKIIMCK